MKFAIRSLYFLLIPLIAGCGGCGGNPAAKIKAKGAEIKKMSAVDSTKDFFTGVGEADVVTMWAHLPDKWQDDVNEVVHLFAGKMDKDLWNKGFAVASKALKVVKEKKKFIIGSELMKMAKEKPTEKQLDDIADLLSKIVDSDLRDLEKVKSLDVGVYLAKTVPDLKAKLESMSSFTKTPAGNSSEVMQKLKDAKVELEGEEKDDTVTLKITLADDTKTEKFVKIDGKWVPETMSKEWDKNFDDLKNKIKNMPTEQIEEMKPQALVRIDKVDGLLDQLLKADSQEAFDKVLGGAMGMFMGGGSKVPAGPVKTINEGNKDQPKF